MSDSEPQLGAEYTVLLSAMVNDGQWSCGELDALPDWEVRFTTPERRLYAVGDAVMGWVFAVDGKSRTVRLTDSDRGRLPISSRMRPRYIAALRQLLAASPAAELQSSAGLADAISEVKGMVNRAIRRDQWDWLSVRHLFGDPTLDALCRWRDDLIRLRHGVIAKETVSVSKDLGRLRETGFFEIARASVTALEAAAPRIGAITSLRNRGDAEASVREVGSTIDDGYIISQVARAKLESANVLHRATLDLLIENLAGC